MPKKENITINMNGGQFSLAQDNAKIYATQNNVVSKNELDNIINGITENLSALKKEDAENIKDVVDMVKEELQKPEPKVGRLRNCVTLIAPMLTIANGIPVLVNNLNKLMQYVQLIIKE